MRPQRTLCITYHKKEMTGRRIGLDVTAAVRQGGGIGRYVRELLRALAKQDEEQQYRLFFASQRPLPHPLPNLPSNFHIRRLPWHDIWHARLWHRLRLPLPVEIFIGRVDLYHSPDFTLPPVMPGTPTVLTVHDLSFAKDPESASPGLRGYLDVVVPRSVQRATHVLADSQATKDDLIELYGTPAEKISVLYSGVEASFRPIDDEAKLAAVRERYHLGAAPFIFSISTIQPRKNYKRLIAAFDAALRNSDFNLVIAGGKGWLYEEIFAEVERRDLAGRVLFPGYVDDADLSALYSAAQALAYPSLYEGFGLPLLEAMACGTPVLASTAPCLPEVAGKAALLVDPYDVDDIAAGLQQIVSDSGLRVELVERGFERAAQFRWEDSARKLVELYTVLARK